MKRSAPSFGRQVYPTPTGGTKRRLSIGVTPLRRCIQCGFVNDTRNTAWSRQGPDVVIDPPQSGCKNCGSLFWQEQKPPKIADDRFKANPSLKQRR